MALRNVSRSFGSASSPGSSAAVGRRRRCPRSPSPGRPAGRRRPARRRRRPRPRTAGVDVGQRGLVGDWPSSMQPRAEAGHRVVGDLRGRAASWSMYSFLSLSTWPSVRNVTHSSSTGPVAAAGVVDRLLGRGVRGDRVHAVDLDALHGVGRGAGRRPTAFLAVSEYWVCSPYWLFWQTNTTGSDHTEARLSDSWKAPMFVAPSPKLQIVTRPSPLSCEARPRPIGDRHAAADDAGAQHQPVRRGRRCASARPGPWTCPVGLAQHLAPTSRAAARPWRSRRPMPR